MAEKSKDDFSPASPRISERIPFVLIGLLLTSTAIAKLWMLLTDSFADSRVGLPKEILWLSVVFEFGLAYLNFFKRGFPQLFYIIANQLSLVSHSPFMTGLGGLSLINTLAFGTFAILGSIRWMLGFGTCGCSGNVEIPNWIFVLLNVIIVAFLISIARQPVVKFNFSWFLAFLTSAFGFSIFLLGVSSLVFILGWPSGNRFLNLCDFKDKSVPFKLDSISDEELTVAILDPNCEKCKPFLKINGVYDTANELEREASLVYVMRKSIDQRYVRSEIFDISRKYDDVWLELPVVFQVGSDKIKKCLSIDAFFKQFSITR